MLKLKMGKESYKVILSQSLSKKDKRYVVIDTKTGEILDDAQGYGYKSYKNAYSAFSYKYGQKKKKEDDDKVKAWLKEHKDFAKCMEDFYMEIAMGKWGYNVKFDTKLLKEMLKDNNVSIPFPASELLKIWKKDLDRKVRKKERKRKEKEIV